MSHSAMKTHIVPFFDLAIKNEAEDKEKAALASYNSLKEGKFLFLVIKYLYMLNEKCGLHLAS